MWCHVMSHLFLVLTPVPRNQLLSVAAACKVLIEFSLLRLENPDEACAVSQVRGSLSCSLTHVAVRTAIKKSNVQITLTLTQCCIYMSSYCMYYCILWITCFPCVVVAPAEAPDLVNKGPLHRMQSSGSNRDHHLHRYDEVCQTPPDSEDALRRWVFGLPWEPAGPVPLFSGCMQKLVTVNCWLLLLPWDLYSNIWHLTVIKPSLGWAFVFLLSEWQPVLCLWGRSQWYYLPVNVKLEHGGFEVGAQLWHRGIWFCGLKWLCDLINKWLL